MYNCKLLMILVMSYECIEIILRSESESKQTAKSQ